MNTLIPDAVSIGTVAVIIGIWSGLLLWAIKMLLDKQKDYLDVRFAGMEEANRKEAEQWQRVERELMDLRAKLPLEYVRREDAIRQEVVINAKLDALAMKLDDIRGAGA